MLEKSALLLIFFLTGSIPFGFIISKVFYRVDIREVGSKNPGATNVWRVLGRKPGIVTLGLDISKGFLPVLMLKHFFPGEDIFHLLGGLSLICGHNWSVFLTFKGGKGVATSTGVFMALIPIHTGAALLGFLLTLLITKRVSVGSMVGAIILSAMTFLRPTPLATKICVLAVAAMILVKHVPNMKRLAQGQEPGVSPK